MCPPSFYYWATFISLPQLPGYSSMASGQRREQIRESHQPHPPNFAQLFMPLIIFWRAWYSLLWVIYFMLFAYFFVRVNQRRRPHKQRLLIVTFLFFIRFSFKLMQIIFDSGLQIESFSGTPWLLDVLNGFIAHNNVSNLWLLFLVSSFLSHHQHFSTISSSSFSTWSTRSTVFSSSSCSSRRRRWWWVWGNSWDEVATRTECEPCSRRPVMSHSPSPAPLVQMFQVRRLALSNKTKPNILCCKNITKSKNT